MKAFVAAPCPAAVRRRWKHCDVACPAACDKPESQADSWESVEQVVGRLQRRGVLTVLRRPEWYVDRRPEYVEPEVIYVLGTSHVSAQSARDCEELVRVVQPDIVVVELCRSRAGLMYTCEDDGQDTDKARSRSLNPFLIRGDGKASFVSSVLRSGVAGTLLRALLVRFASQVKYESGMRMYQDFGAARRAGERVAAEIVLGDRPIEMTLRRSWECMPWRERIKFARLVLSPSSDVSESESEVVADGGLGLLDSYHQVFQTEFPTLHRTLVTERDAYLAWSMKRSHAVCGKKCVVAVVGAGHMSGITRNILADQGGDMLRFAQLIGREYDRENDAPTQRNRSNLVWPYKSLGTRFAALVRRLCIDSVLLAGADAVINQDGMTRQVLARFDAQVHDVWRMLIP